MIISLSRQQRDNFVGIPAATHSKYIPYWSCNGHKIYLFTLLLTAPLLCGTVRCGKVYS